MKSKLPDDCLMTCLEIILKLKYGTLPRGEMQTTLTSVILLAYDYGKLAVPIMLKYENGVRYTMSDIYQILESYECIGLTKQHATVIDVDIQTELDPGTGKVALLNVNKLDGIVAFYDP